MAISEHSRRRLAKEAQAVIDAVARRDQAIRDARAEGATFRDIAAAAGMSPMGVKKLVERTD